MTILAEVPSDQIIVSFFPIVVFLLVLLVFFWQVLRRNKGQVRQSIDAMNKNTEALNAVSEQLKRLADAKERELS